MNKKITLLAAALMTVGTFTANAEGETPVGSEGWTAGNYYYLKSGESYLALDGNKSDSVIVKSLDEGQATKAALDSALWQIADKETALGVTTYTITNKATKDLLSFEAKKDADTHLASGVDRWVLDETNGKITVKGFYDGDKTLVLAVSKDGELSLESTLASPFEVQAPDETFPLNAQQLGNGFSVFQLVFGDTYEGNLFDGKELVAKDLEEGDEGYVQLQLQGDLTWPDGKPKYLGVDTTKTEISGAKGAYGAKFAADSTYQQLAGVHSVGNADFQKFRFTVDLKNDSIAMFVKAAPDVNGETLTAMTGKVIRVVYAQVGSTKVLTVSEAGDAMQGALPKITSRRGTPTTLPDGDGVYFLKNAGKGANAGKYYVAYDDNGALFMGGDSVPMLNIPRGQWLVKENNGKYSVVDRESNTALIWNQEIFAVQGMDGAYLMGEDTVSVEQQGVDLKEKFIGSFTATEQELLDKGYLLSLFTVTPGVPELFIYTPDSVLKGSAEEVSLLFKLYPVDTTVVAGAKRLGDEISVIDYQLGGYFLEGKVAKDKDEENAKGLKFSKEEPALTFRFLAKPYSSQYFLVTGDGEHVGIDINTSNLQLTASTGTSVNIAPSDAPEYATFETGHKRLVSDGNSLVMNPNNFFAQMKTEGSEITKAAYEKENFSLWLEPDTVVAGKQLYFISSAVGDTRYYLSFKDTTIHNISADAYKNVMFLSNDTIKRSENSPALFAFKVNEYGGYNLENQQQLKGKGYPYVGIVNGFVVLEKFVSTAFEVQTASAPTANEEMEASEIKVISRDGRVIVTNASGKVITLSNILGQTIGARRANSGYFSMPATSGIVLVTVEGDTTYKVIVR